MTDSGVGVGARTFGRFTFWASGRPAPQGSKDIGASGQMREASAYLPSWRAAIKRACFEAYARAGIEAGALPLFKGPVSADIRFDLGHGARIDGPPDVDKLARAVLDSLTQARLFEDDARVVRLSASKAPAGAWGSGALITVGTAPIAGALMGDGVGAVVNIEWAEA